MTTIDRNRLKTLQKGEEAHFLASHPKSAGLYAQILASATAGLTN